MRRILVMTSGVVLALVTLTSARPVEKATHDSALTRKATVKIELGFAHRHDRGEVGEMNPVARKYYATCVSGGPGRAHLNRTWDGPDHDKFADAQRDAKSHDDADPNRKCQAWVASADR